MPRIRTIKPKFWDDIKISKISRDSRLTFIGMWNFCDDAGVLISDPVWLKSKLFPFDQIQIQQFEKWLSELSKSGFISLFSYENERFYYLPNFTRHQIINRPNYEDLNVPKDDLTKALEDSLINHGIIIDESVQEGNGMEWKGKERKGKEYIAPEFEEFHFYCKENKFEGIARRAFNHYSLASWKDVNGKPVLNWKQKLNSVWFKEENKDKITKPKYESCLSEEDKKW